MSDVKIGEILKEQQPKDDIHVAILCVSSDEILYPGQHVCLLDVSTLKVGECPKSQDYNPLGIVDPFLKSDVKPGEMFYLFLYPKTITSLRHNWTHPALTSKSYIDDAKAWISAWAQEIGLDYDELMQGADDYINHGNYLSKGSLLGGIEVHPIFWSKYEIVREIKLPAEKKDHFFSCSC